MSDTPDVGALLKASMTAHLEALNARQERRSDDALQAILKAEALRQQAHEADPEHIHGAWAQGPDHEALLAFYEAQRRKAER